MQIAMIGLGRMGMNMSRRLLAAGHEVFAFDHDRSKAEELVSAGAVVADSLEDLVVKVNAPKHVWLMVPAGKAVDSLVESLATRLATDDLIVDGGNSHYKDALRHAERLQRKQIHFVDVGVSGGIWGLKEGYCLMAGGREEACRRLEPIFQALAPEGGYLYCGPAGAGHFVKMIHNGIEYAMMEAYGEGFEVIQASPYGQHVNMRQLAHLWNRGSVIRSWLLELLQSAFEKDPNLESIEGYIEDSGEGRWSVAEAIDSGVPALGIAHALFRRFRSRQDNPFAERVIAALRREFGGHAVVGKGEHRRKSEAGAGEVQAATAAKEFK